MPLRDSWHKDVIKLRKKLLTVKAVFAEVRIVEKKYRPLLDNTDPAVRLKAALSLMTSDNRKLKAALVLVSALDDFSRLAYQYERVGSPKLPAYTAAVWKKVIPQLFAEIR